MRCSIHEPPPTHCKQHGSCGDCGSGTNSALASRNTLSSGLRLRLGDAATVAEALGVVADPAAPAEARLADIAILGETRPEGAREALLAVAGADGPEGPRAAAIAALEGWNDTGIAAAVLPLLDAATPREPRAAAAALLAGRPAWAAELLRAIDAGTAARAVVTDDALMRLRLHRDPTLVAAVERVFGAAPAPGSDAEAVAADLERGRRVLAEGSGSPVLGRTVFRTTCASCHMLFGEGGQIGPDLTSHDRSDPRALLTHVASPSTAIREGYETTVVITADGRTLSGFVVGEDPGMLFLRTADGRTVPVPREDIDEATMSAVSIMPTGLLRGLDDQQVRDLFAYLRATQPLATR